MLLQARVGLGLLALASASCRTTPLADPAPFTARNTHPAQLTVIQPAPRAARPLRAGRVELQSELSWTSLWLRPGSGADSISLDGELVRAVLRSRVGLGGGVDLELALPLLSSSGGLLDAFIEGWHDVFGLPQNERDAFVRNRFRVAAERAQPDLSTVTAYELDAEGLALGDLPVFLTWVPLADARSGVALGLRAGLELPAGSQRRGFGNGELDAALGLLGEWRGARRALFAWSSLAFVGQAERARAAGLDYPDLLPSGGVAVEQGIADGLSAIAQIGWERSLLRRLDDRHARPDQVLLWLGGRLDLASGSDLEFAVAEDLTLDVAPDVVFHLALRMRL